MEAAQSCGIGSINEAALTGFAPIGAQEAAEEVQNAIDEATDAMENGASLEEVATIFVIELYGIDVEEVTTNADGSVSVVNTIEGTHQPGTGVITDDERLVAVDEEGEPIEEESQRLQDEETGEVVSIPHQGVADGG